MPGLPSNNNFEGTVEVVGKRPERPFLPYQDGNEISMLIIRMKTAMLLSLNDGLSLAWLSSSDIAEV